ncbi:Fe-S-cluster-containing hydrogenase component 1 [Rhodopirellula islandica]|uniref:Fe-S-cluster-containing hydrogenase component 1 n=1 Tax=Rhodopirellula islandica TaxID=595434 RepID=A0A0J1BMA6_RHOIS|nr:4Fe-4S dicluster domain-containing protein [Rhodopirellula islandica]KLU07583.1 Fe-S-cluster-containing hydrogenase component 1 [Rhodopirellula islandica]
MTSTETDSTPSSKPSLPIVENFSRRAAVKAGFATLGAGAFVAAISPLRQAAKNTSAAEFMQTHYTELSTEQKADVIARLEAETKEKYGADVTIGDDRPIPGTKFVYAINLSVCNGNGKCVEACHKENNHDRDTNQSYIRVIEMPKGTMDMEQGSTTYTGVVPKDDKFYLPVQCQQCDEPPCVDVCPVKATWKEEDGIVVVDYNWCIGCRYCEAACPYHARRFNWKKPEVPAAEVNPDQSYLSNRIRPVGVVEKCTYCLHRTRRGKLPACLEACPTGARVFGNILDKDSNIRWILENKRVYILKEELGTKPAFFYYFD